MADRPCRTHGTIACTPCTDAQCPEHSGPVRCILFAGHDPDGGFAHNFGGLSPRSVWMLGWIENDGEPDSNGVDETATDTLTRRKRLVARLLRDGCLPSAPPECAAGIAYAADWLDPPTLPDGVEIIGYVANPIDHAVMLAETAITVTADVVAGRTDDPAAFPIWGDLPVTNEATGRRIVAALLNAGWKPPQMPNQPASGAEAGK